MSAKDWLRFGFFGLASFALLPCGCHKTATLAPPGSMVVLVDRTMSVPNRRISQFSQYFQQNTLKSMLPGEKVLVESITDQSTLSNPPMRMVDTKLPAVTAPSWTFEDDYQRYGKKCAKSVDAQLAQYTAALGTVRSETTAAFAPNAGAAQSYILDGVEDAAEFLSHSKGAKLLVLFTDGIEDSQEYGVTLKFDAPGFWSHTSIPKVLDELKSENRMPHLQGAHVYLIGAAAPNPEVFRKNAAFWSAYFAEAGVAPGDLHYGHQPSWDDPAVPDDITAALCTSALGG